MKTMKVGRTSTSPKCGRAFHRTHTTFLQSQDHLLKVCPKTGRLPLARKG